MHSSSPFRSTPVRSLPNTMHSSFFNQIAIELPETKIDEVYVEDTVDVTQFDSVNAAADGILQVAMENPTKSAIFKHSRDEIADHAGKLQLKQIMAESQGRKLEQHLPYLDTCVALAHKANEREQAALKHQAAKA